MDSPGRDTKVTGGLSLGLDDKMNGRRICGHERPGVEVGSLRPPPLARESPRRVDILP